MAGGIKKFLRSPLGRRAIAYLAPLAIGWVLTKLQGGDSKNTSRASRRRK